jgi:hypothetical protein
MSMEMFSIGFVAGFAVGQIILIIVLCWFNFGKAPIKKDDWS